MGGTCSPSSNSAARLDMLAYLIIGYVSIAVLFFARMGRPKAVLATMLVGVLFLPEIQSSPPMSDAVLPVTVPLLEFSKINVISYGLLLGWVLFDFGRGRPIRLRAADAPALLVVC